MGYLILVVFLALAIFLQFRKQRQNLPPSPLALPIIGHLHHLKHPIHRCFHKLSQKYGPIVSLKLGPQLAVIVSSPSLAEECFTTNDLVLANRPYFLKHKYLSYNRSTLGSADYGDQWRMLRRVSYTEVLSLSSLNSFVDIRRDEVRALLRRLARTSNHGFAVVTLRPMLMDLTSNIIMRVVAGKRYYGNDLAEDSEEARMFRKIVEQNFAVSSSTHPADLFSVLRLVDYDGYQKKLANLAKNTDEILQKLVDEIRVNKNGNNMVSRLLALQETQPESYTNETIKSLILSFLLAGTETVATTLEWAMSNLLNHPEVLMKAKQEIDSQIGQDRLVDETDLSKLPYLQGFIAETLRLYPAGPVSLPHLSSQDCSVGGYNIPRGSIVFVNLWAIQRDPDLWENPLSFKPERFENGKYEDYKSKMFPFGKGRRTCPGEELAHRELRLVLASLIQSFEWKRVGENKIDMTEKMVIAMSKVEPLVALCKPHPNIQKLLQD